MSITLNERALSLANSMAAQADELRIALHEIEGGGRVLDCGVNTEGSFEAGLQLARVCTAGLAEVSLVAGQIDGVGWPHVQFRTDSPVEACLLSQYAGLQISVEKFFAMGSGPMRAAAAREELFGKLDYRESPEALVGVLEGGKLPGPEVFQFLQERTSLDPGNITLLIAPTASVAGNLQVVARSVETAMHKLFELGYDVKNIRSAFGTAPLSPVAADDLTGIGRTNDAILYGGQVTLFVIGDDEELAEVGRKVPSQSSDAYGKPFLEIFEEAGRDFYKIDPHLFSPAQVVFHNCESGRVHCFGRTAPDILRRSFSLV